MLSIPIAALFATYATAQLTTSVWLPGAADTNLSFVGSVVAQNGGQTTLSLAFANTPAEASGFYTAPNTVTINGMTAVAYKVSGVDKGTSASETATVSMKCSRAGKDAVPTCTMSTIGADAVVSALCSGLASLPDYCTNPAARTFDQTMTFNGASQHYFNDFQLVITAGADKLGPSATPAANQAAVTGSGAGRANPSPTSGFASRNGPSQANEESASAESPKVGNTATSTGTLPLGAALFGSIVVILLL